MSMPIQPKNIKHILAAVQLMHKGVRQRDIAKTLGVSPATVCRLLASAGQFTEVRYKIPVSSNLQAMLMAEYNLADAAVVELGLPEFATDVLGQAAATYFMENIHDGSGVALSCGETLLKMLQSLPNLPDLKLEISQLSIEGDTAAIHQAPSTLVGLLKAKVNRDSCVRGLQLPPLNIVQGDVQFRDAIRTSPFVANMRAQAKRARYVFIGIGTPLPHNDEWTGCFHQIVRNIPRYAERVRDLRIVGEVNNQLYDTRGRDGTGEFEQLSAHFINILSLADLREASRNAKGGRRVIAVATGRHKVEAIRAALKGGLVNVLITGKDDAEALLAGNGAR